MHFLALADSDRLLRFGTELQDHLITRYVQRLDFVRDTVLGVFNHDLHLTAVAHLNFVPYDSNPLFNGVTDKSRVAEFGLSVLSESRDQGYATRLIERAVSHCRNENVDTLYMHYLASNEAVLYIAQKAGMVITYVPGQHEAFLKLPVISPEPN
jgi:GNAT superfamily N-acetyltransferase